MKVGLVHPGEMGSAVGTRLDAEVLWAQDDELRERVARAHRSAAGAPDGFHRAAAEVYRS